MFRIYKILKVKKIKEINLVMNFTFTSREKIVCIALMIIGVISIAASFMTHNHQAWANLLMSNFYFLAIALGAIFFVAVNYAANSGWMIAVKRMPEAMGSLSSNSGNNYVYHINFWWASFVSLDA